MAGPLSFGHIDWLGPVRFPKELLPHFDGSPDMPIVTVTRRLRFNAAHRVHNPAVRVQVRLTPCSYRHPHPSRTAAPMP